MRWPLLLPRSNNFGLAWLASETRYARVSFPRRARHASSDSPWHSSAKPLPLEGLAPSHRAFQEHATHTIEWSIMLRSKGSLGTCIPKGVSTFFHTAFTAHSEARAETVGVGCRPLFGSGWARRMLCSICSPTRCPHRAQGGWVPFLRVSLQAQRHTQSLIDFVHERRISRTQDPQNECLME